MFQKVGRLLNSSQIHAFQATKDCHLIKDFNQILCHFHLKSVCLRQMSLFHLNISQLPYFLNTKSIPAAILVRKPKSLALSLLSNLSPSACTHLSTSGASFALSIPCWGLVTSCLEQYQFGPGFLVFSIYKVFNLI